MVDKLYSRRKIILPSINKKGKEKRKFKNKFKIFIFIIMMILFISFGSFIYFAFPIFKATCESAAGSLATNITNEAVLEVMKNYTYKDLMNIEKDSSGKINFIDANVSIINNATSEIISKIQARIDKAPTTKVYINFGSVSGISKLKAFGPQFEIELETAGRINSNINSEFEAVGINQTLHKIFLNLNTNIGILTPYGSFSRNFETSVLMVQAIIVGEIPETYYDFDGMSEPGEAYEMIGSL